jgi:pilus assembly protein CpaE
MEAGVHLYLSNAEGENGALFGERVCGLPISLSVCPVSEWIDAAEVATSAVAVVQVDADSPASIKRFEKLAEMSQTPLIAATYEPPLALVRSLLKTGAHDVLPLPLTLVELEASVAQVRAEPQVQAAPLTRTALGRLVLFIKSRGGIGATAIASQLACRYAAAEAKANREACLIDLDIQFGDVAFQLGLQPRLSVCDLVEAGSRLDGQLLRSVAAVHPSGLHVVGAPSQLMPLDSMSSDQAIAVLDRATREFATVFVDLPANWTNWSLSLIARADKILLVTELSVAALNRARRQLDLLAEQDLGRVPLQLIVNRNVRKLLGGGSPVKFTDVEQALGRTVDFSIADDPEVLAAAIERGVPIDTIRRKSAIGKDLDTISTALAADFGLER